MFGSMFSNLPVGICRRCVGDKKLRVRIEDVDGRFVRYDADIICDACDGKGRFKTAADYSSEGKNQNA